MYNNQMVILCQLIFSLIIVLVPGVQPVAAGWLADTMADPLDNRLDASKYLAEKKGVHQVPVIITEPAVDYGLSV